MTKFQSLVLAVVRMVPSGRVMSYGQVAACIGAPRAARQVGWALHAMTGTPDFPWWRIVNNAGLISIKDGLANSKEIQAGFLRAEDVEVSDQLNLDIEAYRYHPTPEELRQLELDPAYIEKVIERYG
jgi:methylated-DNA-protein-cysteine methyltransferase related protein